MIDSSFSLQTRLYIETSRLPAQDTTHKIPHMLAFGNHGFYRISRYEPVKFLLTCVVSSWKSVLV